MTRFTSVRLLLLLLPFLLIGGAYILYRQEPFRLIDPHKTTLNNLRIITDTNEQGHSKVTLLENQSNKLSFKYSLSNALRNPYAGVEYESEEGKFFDLSEYDYVKVKIKASKGKRLLFSVGTRIEVAEPQKLDFVYYEKGIPVAFRMMSTTLNTDTVYRDLLIPVKELVTPEWWFISSKIAPEAAAPDYSKSKFVYFGQCINIPTGTEDLVEVKELGFYKDYNLFYVISALGLAGYFAIMGLVIYKRKKLEVNFHHGKLASILPLTGEEESVFGFITAHYMKPELSVTELQKACGYSESRIAEIIKKKTGMNFKAFLNKLRISEAKRLLLETDFTISEIAEKVGYGHISHFNRVFKALEGNAPGEFKKGQSVSLGKK